MMSKSERTELERLRLMGYGPTAISYEIGVSVNTIKSYIRRHPSLRNFHKCLYCGKAVTQTKGRKEKKFCSDRCRMAYWNNQYRNGGKKREKRESEY